MDAISVYPDTAIHLAAVALDTARDEGGSTSIRRPGAQVVVDITEFSTVVNR